MRRNQSQPAPPFSPGAKNHTSLSSTIPCHAAGRSTAAYAAFLRGAGRQTCQRFPSPKDQGPFLTDALERRVRANRNARSVILVRSRLPKRWRLPALKTFARNSRAMRTGSPEAFQHCHMLQRSISRNGMGRRRIAGYRSKGDAAQGSSTSAPWSCLRRRR